ncbi:hypothetical protein AAG906_013155 [Vitis piasezkii]
MENEKENKVYVHYTHTHPTKFSRWTARESHQFMYKRPWQQVLDFYSNVVTGRCSLLGLLGIETHPIHDGEIVEASDKTEFGNVLTKDRGGRWARLTFKIVLSYHGASFDGWQKQPGLNTVQGLVEASLGRFVDERKAQQLKEKNLPVEGMVTVAGRTDKGVTALQQVCSFYTWKKDAKVKDIEDAINGAATGKLRVISVSENTENLIFDDDGEFESRKKPSTFSISRVDQLLRQLEGKLLSYKIFARDTKASRNIGPPTECFVFHARATEARLQFSDDGEGTKVMCIELVANRFLRKMVRVLVATSIREAAAGAEQDALLKLMDATCRRATAPPAPPDGLCLIDVGFTEFDPQICFIR